ncbi:MAG: alpha-1,4-glucan--maltose-1-phosphate maltosyltransferase [Alphaproteobacteria bacterium]|nr:alpha-1,4-glucan--maltose-1-phosphate maltosyltransferase [Alphaproteobacteria bacterium]
MAPDARIIIDHVEPVIDGGRYAVKATIGSPLTVQADIFADGHEMLAATVVLQCEESRLVTREQMVRTENDRYVAELDIQQEGAHTFHIEAWIDVYGGFVRDTQRKREAGQSLALELQEGRGLVAQAREKTSGCVREALDALLNGFEALDDGDRIHLLTADETRQMMRAVEHRLFLTQSRPQRIEAERTAASFASWYELFPRSQSPQRGRHGTLRDVIAQLPRIRAMGFDVLYMTPIHPIGHTNRKGPNNALASGPNDPGSTYAIGSQDGGHDAIHPELGTISDFRDLVSAARAHGMELALDFAAQMSPDHPWLEQHPHWFPRRPDGSRKYAENPPKKYEDIVNPDFYSDPKLWLAFRDVLLFWAEQGVRTFRVDNPHTKPIPFWEWIIAEIKAAFPDTIFLSEAFTRPARMMHLAKVGFSQSYTYFTWRNTKAELTEYLTELAANPLRYYFRPNFFVNTPDINPPFLQTGGRPAFLIRAALAATSSGLWGMYSGFEICEAAPLPGREEYADSEKYQIRQRRYDTPDNIAGEITQLNMLRRLEPALQSHLGITFHNAFNDNILYYAKTAPDREDRILVAINLDPSCAHECDFEVPMWDWGLPDEGTVDVEDLLHGDAFSWHGKLQRLRLEPSQPYAIWRCWPRQETA